MIGSGYNLDVTLSKITGGFTTACNSLPSFFVIGPPRTGTTWLHEVLRERVCLPSLTKETRFFDTYYDRGIDWYLAKFERPTHPIGEIAPTYFTSSAARERIARFVPKAKVVCIFRNPVERVISLYQLKRAYGMIPGGFEEAITSDPELLESSKYATTFKLWQCGLGAERVLATVYEDLRNDPQTYIDALVDFIGIPRFALAPSQIRRVNESAPLTHPRNYVRTRNATALAESLKARRLDFVVAAVRKSFFLKLFLGGGSPFAELPREVLLKLYELFRPEVEELEAILNRDLSSWKSANPAPRSFST